jgi:hypothetical protein
VGGALLALVLALTAAGQTKPGGVKGKVRVDEGATAEGVRVSVRQGEEELAHADTDRNGRFEIAGLAPGRYRLVFRKAGLKTAEIRDYEVSANKVRSLGDRVFMAVDEGSLALLKGSVFNAAGRSLRGAAIELARVLPDGKVERIDGRVSNELGQFAFRLLPSAARYRVTAKFSGFPPVAKEIDIEGPAVYRIALSVGEPAP